MQVRFLGSSSEKTGSSTRYRIHRRMERRYDSAILVGTVVGALSLLLPIVSLKPNRVADGVPLRVLEVGGVTSLILMIATVAILLLLGILSPPRRLTSVKGGTVVVQLSIVLFVLIVGGGAIVDGESTNSRMTLSFGFWIYLLSFWIILSGVLNNLNSRMLKPLLTMLPLVLLVGVASRWGVGHLSLAQEFLLKQGRVFGELGNHLQLTGIVVLLSTCIGVPIGVVAWRSGRGEKQIFGVLNTIQTIPSLALFGFLIFPLSILADRFPLLRSVGIRGIGSAPAVIALTLYALLPVVRNTFVGMKMIEQEVAQAGIGMGMSRGQLFRWVEIPIALPLVLSGVRVSAIQAVGNTAVAALIGAGGLGVFVFQGLGQGAPDLIVLGVVPVVLIALTVDRLMGMVINMVTSPGITPN